MIETIVITVFVALPFLTMVAEAIRRRIDARPRGELPRVKPNSAIADDPSKGVRVKGRGVRVRIKEVT